MGISANPPMLFDLANLIASVDSLQDLVEPFQQMEIDLIVKRMPTDKAPGPDGFNGLFMKKCWHIIRSDFYSFCNDFYRGQPVLNVLTHPSSHWSRRLIALKQSVIIDQSRS